MVPFYPLASTSFVRMTAVPRMELSCTVEAVPPVPAARLVWNDGSVIGFSLDALVKIDRRPPLMQYHCKHMYC